ncbi:CS1 fimbrial subunit B flags: Precursor [Stenotrophomonas forensis]|uniref:CS1 fimbrial subunit B flags: Precursor n=1 Tax=Stenotrophomonas forensis TaxID=2871169 RepID=UPI0018D2CC9D|nr:CS1 fimbrial subunit B flags: Precursor [Stenotrophomonas maltophilia]MBH1600226.1 CS1 fimbrial subunit B flags: Precursor [Stenotrophomonas maltophilia]
MSRIVLLLASLAAAASSQAGTPQINVGPLFDYLPATSSHLLKRVRNTGDVTAYVRVEVTQIHFDAEGKPSEAPVDTAALVRNAGNAQGLIASPGRLIIAANGQQATRLVYRGLRDEEHYYRLRFIPVVPTADEFSLSEVQLQEASGLASAIHVFTGYGTILFVAPSVPRHDTRLEGNIVHNHGNTTVVLDNLRYCEQDRADDCSPGILAHVRPGQRYTLKSGPTRFARYDLLEGEARRSVDTRR